MTQLQWRSARCDVNGVLHDATGMHRGTRQLQWIAIELSCSFNVGLAVLAIKLPWSATLIESCARQLQWVAAPMCPETGATEMADQKYLSA